MAFSIAPTAVYGIKRVRRFLIGLAGAVLVICIPAPNAASQTGAITTSAGQQASPLLLPPSDMTGAWQLRIEGREFKLRANYTVEIKMGDGRLSPVALISYFAGDPQRPSTICRTQLEFGSQMDQTILFHESLNYRMGKDPCPVWGQVAIERRDGRLWIQWRKISGKRSVVKMQGFATPSTNGAECRTIGGDSRTAGKIFCRTPDGDWLPRPE